MLICMWVLLLCFQTLISYVRMGACLVAGLLQEVRTPHPVCPVRTLKSYLTATMASHSFQVFVHVRLYNISVNKLNWYLCYLIRKANPGFSPLSHDLRKIGSSFAFLWSMSVD